MRFETFPLRLVRELHVVSGPPAAGKSRYSRELAERLGGCWFDSDAVTERLVRAGLELAGLDPDDRDSPAYKAAYREAVYETLFDLAAGHLPRLPVVVAGPFTREGGEADWPERLERRLGTKPVLHFVWCDAATRRRRMIERGAERDRPKLEDWERYVKTCREGRPVWKHVFVDTSE